MPARFTDSPEKVATPATTATGDPPVRVAPLGLAPKARPTVVVLSAVSTLPLASSTATVTAGLMAAPAAALVGFCVKASWAAGPGVNVMVDDVATTSPSVVSLAESV